MALVEYGAVAAQQAPTAAVFLLGALWQWSANRGSRRDWATLVEEVPKSFPLVVGKGLEAEEAQETKEVSVTSPPPPVPAPELLVEEGFSAGYSLALWSSVLANVGLACAHCRPRSSRRRAVLRHVGGNHRGDEAPRQRPGGEVRRQRYLA